MNTQKLSPILALTGLCLAVYGYCPSAQAAEFCADAYSVDVTLPNGARWDLCWEHRAREGIVLHKIHYTPRSGERRMVLNSAGLAQIHVPYDDNGARYHDISDYGLGGAYMENLGSADCEGGELLAYDGKNVLCKQQEQASNGFQYSDDSLQGNAFTLFSVSKIGSYNYIPLWRFFDDGAIEPSVGATGALQRYANGSLDDRGWLVAENKVGIAHLHNFFWRLDFDLVGTGTDDYVEELNFTQGDNQVAIHKQRLAVESARNVSPAELRRWRVVDGGKTNAKGLPVSYEIRLPQSDHQDVGPDSEPFTYNDIYFTRHKACELYASHNPTMSGCAENLSAFTDGEALTGQDLVVWPSTTFYHMPRAEDSPRMDAHWSSISLVPRDWHDRNPLSDVADISGSDLVDGGGTGSGTGTGTGNGTGNGSGSGSGTGNGTGSGTGTGNGTGSGTGNGNGTGSGTGTGTLQPIVISRGGGGGSFDLGALLGLLSLFMLRRFTRSR